MSAPRSLSPNWGRRRAGWEAERLAAEYARALAELEAIDARAAEREATFILAVEKVLADGALLAADRRRYDALIGGVRRHQHAHGLPSTELRQPKRPFELPEAVIRGESRPDAATWLRDRVASWFD